MYATFSKVRVHYAQNLIQATLKNIFEYSVKHGLNLNEDKSKLIIFGAPNTVVSNQIQIQLNGDIIEKSGRVTSLGFIIIQKQMHYIACMVVSNSLRLM